VIQAIDIQTHSSFLTCVTEEKKKKTKATQMIDIQAYTLFVLRGIKKIEKN